MVHFISFCYGWSKINKCLAYGIWNSTQEFGPYFICRKLRIRSACVFAQYDQDLCYLLADSLHTVEYMHGQRRPWSNCVDVTALVLYLLRQAIKCLRTCAICDVWYDSKAQFRLVISTTCLFKYIENFISKYWNFLDKNSDIFHITAQNIDCGYSLEPPRRGGSNEYTQSMFLIRNKKK